MMYDMTYGQHQLVYNFTSFTLASMMASTVFFWLRLWGVSESYRSALCITGLVTFIAFYHYVRIFNSWVDAYDFPSSTSGDEAPPKLTGVPFNDAYRYMDWLLTVPLLLMELVLVMDMSAEEKQKQSAMLGVTSAAMIAVGYPGEMITQGPFGTRWACWFFSMCVFSYIVYTLLKGLDGAHQAEVANDAVMAGGRTEKAAPLIHLAKVMTVISWCTYPVVYIFPMMGMTGAQAVIGIQVGYCVSDIISKCGVGLLTYRICVAKSGPV
jgi:bacteriorhodopsin